MDFGGPRKRGRHEGSLNGNGGFKKSRPESESFQSGVGSKSKPCTKFFSTSGCPFGEGCHFLHHVPGGFKAVSQMLNLGGAPVPPPRNVAPSYSDGPATPSGKTKICNKFNSPEGCKYGDKCHFAHGERQLGRPSIPSYEDPRGMGYMGGRMGGRMEPPPPGIGAAANFGESSTAKLSIDAALAGAVIGKSGINSKQICRVTGVKLSIRDHETDSNKRNIQLEGTFDQIKQASSMVEELIRNVKAASGGPPVRHSTGHGAPGGGSNFKTRLCENFTKGSCTFGDRCHFAHGADEMRKSAI